MQPQWQAPAQQGAFGHKVVNAYHYDGSLNTSTAEHHKVMFNQSVGDVKFSSPFNLSGGDGAPPAATQPLYTGGGYHPAPCPPVPDIRVASYQSGYTQASYQSGYATTSLYQDVPPQQQWLPPLGPTPPVIEGWLAKRGEHYGKPWNMRWFVLQPSGELTYGKDQKDPGSKNIALTPSTKVRALVAPDASEEGLMMGSKKMWGFEIYMGPGIRTWFIDAGCMEKRDVWMRKLHDVIAQLQVCAAVQQPLGQVAWNPMGPPMPPNGWQPGFPGGQAR